jgi:tetratricopeptide (TPR) repeat protein
MGSTITAFKMAMVLTAIIILSSYAGFGITPVYSKNDLAQDAIKSHTQTSSRSEVLYHILVAELANRRGQTDDSLKHYQIAARTSDNPKLLEYAFGIALQAQNNTVLLQLARHWYGLAPNEVRARQALALALLRNDRLEEAMPYIESIRAEANDDGQEGFASINLFLSRNGSPETAFTTMEKLRTLHPKSLFANYYYASNAVEVEKTEQALKALQTALQQDSDWTPAHLLQARILVDKGSTEKALNNLREAVVASPENQELRKGYARLLADTDQLEDAFRQFRVLSQQNSDDIDAFFASGVLATELQRFAEARTYLTKVLQADPQNSAVYFELGKLEELQENYRKAADWYAQVTDNQRYLSAQVRIGAMLAKLGNLSDMTQHFIQIRRENPSQLIDLYVAEAETLREEGLYKKAFDLLSKALEQHPDDENLLYTRALAAEKLNRLDLLERDLKQIIAANPKNGHALNALGYTLTDRTDRHQEALGYIKRAIALLPDDAAVLDSMGWALYQLGQYDKSLEYLRRAYAISNDDEIAAHLSVVLWAAGQREEARKTWEQALQKVPDSEHLLKFKDRFTP